MEENTKSQFPTNRLVADNLCCKRGGRLVFEELSFDVGPGEFLLLKGKNGSGKTTLLRSLAGFLAARAGSVSYGSETLQAGGVAGCTAFIYSGHEHGLKPVLTLRENSAAYYQLMMGEALPDDTLFAAADAFALSKLIDHPLRFFSSGQTHRCALLRFALLSRHIWLMDEPTVGLDSENRMRLQALMAGHLEAGGIIIAASHDPIDLPSQVLELGSYAPKKAVEEMWL